MAKEITIYEASDGKQFKTKTGAENHEKKLIAQTKQEELGMTADEITSALKKTAEHNRTIKVLLNNNEDWTKWPLNLIKQITKEILSPPLKKTLFVKEYRSWGEDKEQEIATEKGISFADPELHVGEGPEMYEVISTEKVNDYTMKVFYDYKYDDEEKISMKLKSGTELSESEIEFMYRNFNEVYEEEGDEGRWERYMTTVVESEGVKYAIEWARGLTESQENSFFEQPYKVKVEEKEVTFTRTVITKL